jgi:hypothetical protein
MIAGLGRWAAGALVVVALACCADPHLSQGRVEGVVLAGPTCPVEQPGQLCLPRPVDGEVQAMQNDQVKASAHTDPSGRFELAVAAGNYTLTVDVGGPFPRCEPVPVEVRVAATVTADIDCDTGIR